MFLYQQVFYAIANLLALYVVTRLGAAMYDHGILSYALLGAACVYLLAIAVKYNREGHRFPSMFVAATALMPPAFYVQYRYMRREAAHIDPAVFAANLEHAITVYNVFRLVFLIMCALIFIKELYAAVRDFGRERN